MRRHSLLLSCFSAVAFTVGCNEGGTTSQQLAQAQAKSREAAQDMKDFSYAQKAQFLERMQDQLVALDRDLDELAARIDRSSDGAKAEAKPKLQALRGQAARLSLQLEQVRHATESTWDSLRDGCRKTYASSQDGFQQARQWASASIAP